MPTQAYETYYVCMAALQSNTGTYIEFCSDVFVMMSTFVVKSSSATTLDPVLSVPYTTSFTPQNRAYFVTWNMGSRAGTMNFTFLAPPPESVFSVTFAVFFVFLYFSRAQFHCFVTFV